MRILERPGVALAIAHEAARRIACEPNGLTARAVGDLLNGTFAAEPATRDWVLSRRDVEHVLSRDDRFERSSDGLWHVVPSRVNVHVAAPAPNDTPVFGLRPGISLDLRAWQHAALAAWGAAGRRGIVQAVTGSGKTLVGVAAIEAHLRSVRARVAVIVPTIELQMQWLAQLRRTFAVPVGAVGDGQADGFATHVILVYVARSAAESLPGTMRRLGSTSDVLLIADECHRYGSETYARALDGEFATTLGLSATPERDGDDGMERYVLPRLGPVIFEYGHDAGVDERVISDFRLCFVGVDFAPAERSQHDALSDQISRATRSLLREFPFLEHASPLTAAIKMLAARDDGLAKRYLYLTSERKRLLDGASSRHDFVAWLAERRALDGQQFLVFHETIADCEYLVESLNRAGIRAGAHHSELHRHERSRSLARFSRRELQALVAPRTLDEGIDVPDVALAIIVAGTRVKRQTIQRIGRVIRRAPGKSFARILKLFVRGANDDPATSGTDIFSRELLTRGRAIRRMWPTEGDDILTFLRAQNEAASSDATDDQA